MAASLISLGVILRQLEYIKTDHTSEAQAFDPTRFVKVEPSVSGPNPDALDATIKARVLYNEGMGIPVEYHVSDTVAEIVALANPA
jgi:hypothetical protein